MTAAVTRLGLGGYPIAALASATSGSTTARVVGWFDGWDRRRRIPVEMLRAILKEQGSSWADELGDAYEAAEKKIERAPRRRKLITAALEDVSVRIHELGHDWGHVAHSLNAVATAQRETAARKHAENIRIALQSWEDDDEEALMLLLAND